MRTNIRILQLCRSVKHVEIRGFDHPELDALVEALKNTSLITFEFSMSKQVPTTWPPPRKVGRFTQLFDMMQRWPRLRSIRVKRRMTLWRWIHPVPRNAQAFKKSSSPVLLSMLLSFEPYTLSAAV